VKNKHVIAFDAIDDNEFAHRETTQARAQVVIAPPADLWILRQKPKTICDDVDKAIANLYAAALPGKIKPDVVKLGFGPW
jgi:hypothetical protein